MASPERRTLAVPPMSNTLALSDCLNTPTASTAAVPFPASDVLVPSGLPDQWGLQGDREGSPAWTKARTSTPCVAPTSRT